MNCHAHSISSLLDGMSKFDGYMGRAVELGMQGATFTEHGNLFGLIDSYEAAKKHGVKYFPGLEAYQARKTRFDRDPEERASGSKSEWGQHGPYHLGIIAYNNVGYQNLLKLSSESFLSGYYVKPRIDHELLAQHSDGLVVLSGCLSGEIQQALTRDDYEFALKTAATFQDIVGKENYFIEVQNHGIDLEIANYPRLLEIAKAIGADVVATCDSHYTFKDEHTAHDICLCLNTGSRIDTPDRLSFTGDYHLKSYEEMALLFPEEYLDNTLKIFEKHDFKLSFEDHHMPNFPVPTNQSVDEYFVDWVYRGVQERFGPDWRSDKRIVDRLDYEMQVIREMEFPNYFLIVADIVDWARKNKIMTGPGRGSVAGSLVAYCMKITEVEPLKYDTAFERFLIPGRKSLPDIDLDFDDRFRDDVVQYARSKYGFDRTAQIGTVSEIGAKTAIRDVARVLNHPYSLGDEINKAMPPSLFGIPRSLDQCLESEEFRKLYESNDAAREVIDAAKTFEGQWRQTGMHAAGLVITDKPIVEYVPLLQKGKDKQGNDNPIITQWDMKIVDKLGLLKIDFLGLRNISIMDMTIETIKRTKGVTIENPYLLVDQQDPEVYEALGNGDNVGIFQLESAGLLSLMIGMKPSKLEDIAALLALYRPGPMGSNFHNEYVERKHGRKTVRYLHQALKPHLQSTYGLLIYQEQVLNIARFVAGFSVPDSDGLRKAMGKKIPAEMAKWKTQFISGCMETSKFSKQLAEQLFTEIEHHADYSFGKGHAVGYAFISYMTSYLKTKYPTEFMAAAMTSLGADNTNRNRLKLYLKECQKKGIAVLPPSIKDRSAHFEVLNEDEIRYGFESVKGFGEKSVELIAQDTGEYDTFFQFLRNGSDSFLDRSLMSSLIDAGCLDEFFTQLHIKQPALNRREKIDMLYREMDTLGIFLSDHPFNNVLDLVAGKYTHTISQMGQLSANEKVRIAGIVVGIEKKITRSGKKMFTLIVEDADADVRVVMMPALVASLPEDPYSVGDIVVVTGKTKRDSDDENETTDLIMFEAYKIEDRSLIGGNPIFINTKNQLTFSQLKRISDIIDNNKGNCPVFITFFDGDKEVKMRYKTLASENIQDTLNFLIKV